MKTVFISPSDQYANSYAYGGYNEAEVCKRIADFLCDDLKRCGVKVYMLHEASLKEKCAKSNSVNADLHVAIHTNAFNRKVQGTRLFTYDTTGKGYKAAKKIMNYLGTISPGSDSILADPSLYEIRVPAAPTVYCECEFHDNVDSAKWIVSNLSDIAAAICQGICDYFGIKYVSRFSDRPRLYRVQVGAFSVRKNAERLLRSLKADGFTDAFIKEE